MTSLSATDRHHDLELIAVGEQRPLMETPGNDLAVALDRDLLAGELELREQRGDLHRRLEAVRLAVDRDQDHDANDTAWNSGRRRPVRSRPCGESSSSA